MTYINTCTCRAISLQMDYQKIFHRNIYSLIITEFLVYRSCGTANLMFVIASVAYIKKGTKKAEGGNYFSVTDYTDLQFRFL